MNFGGMLSQKFRFIESASSAPLTTQPFPPSTKTQRAGISTSRARCIDTQMGSVGRAKRARIWSSVFAIELFTIQMHENFGSRSTSAADQMQGRDGNGVYRGSSLI
ncbi:hypothetical protein J7T55_005667 [Diaporthe amygdali]|uniref:uncharacterized protein n=1 Tax=Phomopsis amygdali TaxID=1214568 RepID=UPI0022FEC549|nr:uncharacterized protein J7T55_005667 [Diaporthe amygdali]KAJ0124329.1 hypothetical protein J7T55_005667 [Diaporthe amygdali]